ncbi:phosphopantetheine adenylyltransferase [Clostridia bacterium]|nr:phosphopantetheine adenylyltransferase [Clostridia bacterium]
MSEKNRIAIYPGSFDPVTFGHIDIIDRAARLFDEIIVLIAVNPTKPASFTPEERKRFLETVTAKIPNVKIDICNGLIVDYFKETGANVLIKGLRAMSDFEYEFQMALVNKDMCYKAETVFLCADVLSTFISSSTVKQIAMFGGDITTFVPESIAGEISERLLISKP